MISLVLFIYTHKCLVHMSMPDRMAKYFQSRLNMSIGTFYNDIGKRNRMKNSQMCTCLFFFNDVELFLRISIFRISFSTINNLGNFEVKNRILLIFSKQLSMGNVCCLVLGQVTQINMLCIGLCKSHLSFFFASKRDVLIYP